MEHILASIEALLEESEAFEPKTVTRTFTLSSTDLKQKVILPQLLRIIRLEAPGVKLSVRKLEIDQITNALLTGEVDLVISKPSFVPSNLPTLNLYPESYTCVASKNNAMVSKKMTISDIAKISQLVVSPSRGDCVDATNDWFEQQGHPRNVVLSVPTFTAAKACIVESDLCGFIPSRLLQDNNLKIIELDKSIPGFDIIAAWHQRSSQDPLHKWIRNKLVSICSL